MKNCYLIAVLFCLSSVYSQAQNYQCLRNDSTIYWFTNSDHYLRGIRIDSVRISGADTIYYLYHTERNHDTAGASWVGKNVIQKSNGTFLFNNAYHDTIIIQTQAALGDSWNFYSDSGKTFYMATVTSLDTMTILGGLDSVKKVTINAFNPAPDSDDLVNNFSFILSKYHGFVQVFDLYNFPYRSASDTSVACADHYFQFLNTSWGNLIPQIFSITDFHVPANLELYDYHPGDAFQWETETYDYSHCTCPVTDYYGYLYDSVLSRVDIDSVHVTLTILKREDLYAFYCSEPDSDRSYHAPYSFVDTLRVDNTAAFSMNKLPEEYPNMGIGSQKAYYYNPVDTSGCFVSKSFLSTPAFVFEGCVYKLKYKNGLGLIDTNFCQGSSCPYAIGVAATTETKLIYARKNNIACGTVPPPLEAKNLLLNKRSITISPNPVNDALSIKVSNTYSGTLVYTISNTIGQTLQRIRSSASMQVISVRNWPSGLYFIDISDGQGWHEVNKVVIAH